MKSYLDDFNLPKTNGVVLNLTPPPIYYCTNLECASEISEVIKGALRQIVQVPPKR